MFTVFATKNGKIRARFSPLFSTAVEMGKQLQSDGYTDISVEVKFKFDSITRPYFDSLARLLVLANGRDHGKWVGKVYSHTMRAITDIVQEMYGDCVASNFASHVKLTYEDASSIVNLETAISEAYVEAFRTALETF